MFTADVAQAFPSVRPRRMCHRLLDLGFEAKFAVFAESFLTGRTVRMRLGGPDQKAPGLPQGSPLSPVLFALYMAPLAQGRDDLYNYVDDIAVFVSARTHDGAKKLLRDRFTEVQAWVSSEGLTLDLQKTDVLFFKPQKQPEEVDLGGGLVVWAGTSLEWLGVHLDSRLGFKTHAEQVVRKATRVVGLLARVSKVYRGLPPKAAAVAAKATVGSVTQYTIEAWWPGLQRSRLGRTYPTGGKGLAKTINAMQTAAARAAVPSWRTTPTAEVRATCQFPPVEVVAGSRRRQYRRKARDDASHVVHSRVTSAHQTRLTDNSLVEASTSG